MKLPRLRLTLRSLMALVLVLALPMGYAVRLRDRGRRRVAAEALMFAQYEATQVVLREAQARAGAWAEAVGRRDRAQVGVGGGSTSQSSGERWGVELDYSANDGPTRSPLIRLKLGGGAEDFSPRPIVVEDRGGEYNAQVVEWLGRVYREKGWAYRVERAPGGSR